MRKDKTPQPDVWNDTPTAAPQEEPRAPEILDFEDAPVETDVTSVDDLKPEPIEYSLEGLKEDFPKANDLEKFVFDETNVSLKLKGIDPEKKYEIALAVLNGEDIDPRYITGSNPYVDNNDLIPEDPIKPIPKKDPRLPNREPMSIFHDMAVPHPNADMRAVDAKVMCQFKTYDDGSISYEILGPLEKHSFGEKVDKYGRPRPEKYVWIDPRTGEQVVVREDGTLTPQGRRICAMMQTFKVNKSNQWEVWIDREFISLNDSVAQNPWDLNK